MRGLLRPWWERALTMMMHDDSWKGEHLIRSKVSQAREKISDEPGKDPMVQAIMAYANSGMSQIQIADALGVNSSKIYNIARDHGIQMKDGRKSRRKPVVHNIRKGGGEVTVNRIIALANDGYSGIDIAKAVNRSPSYVSQVLKGTTK